MQAPLDCGGNFPDAGWRKSPKQKNKHQSSKSAHSKESCQAENPLEEDANKNKTQKKNSPVFPLHVPGHDMNLFKVILAQSKAMKLTWSTNISGGEVSVRFQGAKKRPAKGEELNSLVSNAVKEVCKINKILKAKASRDSGSEDEQENFNFDTPKIGEERRKTRSPRSNAAEVPESGTEE